MKYVFINLDEAVERRLAVEESFRACAHAEQMIERLRAVTGAEASAPGAIGAREKACYLSHLKAIETVAPGETLFIAEDDVRFGQRSTRRIEAVEGLPSDAWDLIYTDVAVTDLAAMIDLFRRRRAFKEDATPDLLDFTRTSYAGSTAYIVNSRARGRLADLLRSAPLDQPYDLFLRDLTCAGRISAFVLFPFATTLSPDADRSQIQADIEADRVAVWNAFRRLVWEGRDLNAVRGEADSMRPQATALDSQALVALIEALLANA